MNIGSTVGSTFTTAANGIGQSSEQFKRAAQEVVGVTTERPVEGADKLAEPVTDLKQAERSVEANAKVLDAADKTLGSIIDVQA